MEGLLLFAWLRQYSAGEPETCRDGCDLLRVAMVAFGAKIEEKPSQLPKKLFGYDVVSFLGQGAASDILRGQPPRRPAARTH